MTGHEDEVKPKKQDATQGTEADISVAALAEALQALDAVDGDLQRLRAERPDLEALMAHLEVGERLKTLRGTPPADAAEALRNALADRAREGSGAQPSEADESR